LPLLSNEGRAISGERRSSSGLLAALLLLLVSPAFAMTSTARQGGILFTDVTATAGIDFVHDHGGSGRHYYPETMSGGAAFLDYDGDGRIDVFLVQSAPLPGHPLPERRSDALYRNRGDGTFVEVSRAAGLRESRYGMGVAAGDFDNDGDQDLFVTNLEGPSLYANNGDGTFTDVTGRSGVQAAALATSAAFLDFDRDGSLDLFVARYMDWSPESNQTCHDVRGRIAYCSPNVYQGTHSLLFRGTGRGTFVDVTDESGVGKAIGRSLGIATADYDEDGLVDVYVAADLTPNFLFLNNGDGTLREEGLLAGVAYGLHGVAQAGMGVDAGDYDNDGWTDLVVTNFENEPNAVYHNLGGGIFVEESSRSGVGGASLMWLGWGIGFVDVDLDGDLDLFFVNGHVDDHADERGRAGYAQPARVYRNEGDGTFKDVSESAGEFFVRRQVARSAAFGDYDDDGDTDVLIGVNNGRAVLLRNDTRRHGNWVRLRLYGRHCNRDGLGARLQVEAGSTSQTRYLRSGGSYLADHDRRLLFGIGAARQAKVRVRWPCGATQVQTADVGTTTLITEPQPKN
jgi:hypothetical protein